MQSQARVIRLCYFLFDLMQSQARVILYVFFFFLTHVKVLNIKTFTKNSNGLSFNPDGSGNLFYFFGINAFSTAIDVKNKKIGTYSRNCVYKNAQSWVPTERNSKPIRNEL